MELTGFLFKDERSTGFEQTGPENNHNHLLLYGKKISSDFVNHLAYHYVREFV